MSDKRARVGVLGAGQLALMLIEAGRELNIDVVPAGRAGDCAFALAQGVDMDLEDPAQVLAFSHSVDVLTLESENVEAAVLADVRNLAPSARAVRIMQDRLFEKDFLRFHGVGTAPYAEVNSLRDLHAALDAIGTPAILKTRRLGYDGRGQIRIQDADDASAAWAHTGGAPCILEGRVAFELEVSLLGARSSTGELAFYPLVRNEHRDGILRVSTAPWHHASLQRKAEEHMRALLEALDYVGVLAIEFFVVEGALIANEMAPRVHNSGHWTIEGSATSQFGNHLRAVLGMPLGSTASTPHVMLNCIGAMPAEAETSEDPLVARHDYGKTARPGRKVGHLTLPGDAAESIERWKKRLTELAG